MSTEDGKTRRWVLAASGAAIAAVVLGVNLSEDDGMPHVDLADLRAHPDKYLGKTIVVDGHLQFHGQSEGDPNGVITRGYGLYSTQPQVQEDVPVSETPGNEGQFFEVLERFSEKRVPPIVNGAATLTGRIEVERAVPQVPNAQGFIPGPAEDRWYLRLQKNDPLIVRGK